MLQIAPNRLTMRCSALLATARQRPGQGILQASAVSFLKRQSLTAWRSYQLRYSTWYKVAELSRRCRRHRLHAIHKLQHLCSFPPDSSGYPTACQDILQKSLITRCTGAQHPTRIHQTCGFALLHTQIPSSQQHSHRTPSLQRLPTLRLSASTV